MDAHLLLLARPRALALAAARPPVASPASGGPPRRAGWPAPRRTSTGGGAGGWWWICGGGGAVRARRGVPLHGRGCGRLGVPGGGAGRRRGDQGGGRGLALRHHQLHGDRAQGERDSWLCSHIQLVPASCRVRARLLHSVLCDAVTYEPFCVKNVAE